MSYLEDYFSSKPKLYTLDKWSHYFRIYDRHFSKYRGQSPVVLEVGVQHGGSLEMWKDYFGEGVKIWGVDISPECLNIKLSGVEILIGDQEDPSFWDQVKSTVPKVDILIDDGGHTMEQQKNTLCCMYDHIKDDGIYLCEDTHTSYVKDGFSGGYKQSNTFIEHTKNFVDSLHAHWFESSDEQKKFRNTTDSVHYYDSVVVLEKKVSGRGAPCISFGSESTRSSVG